MAKRNSSDTSSPGNQSNSKRYIYEQLADRLCASISGKSFLPGDRITSMNELASTCGVNKMTAIKAVRLLESRGILVTIPSKGTYVADNAIELMQAP
ncbi:MAG: winged helix-turn-helix transcriptional regulator, partial [Planctomycetes bacterium]|nr:winged helix-turn-helix transcriptional regulator [Planctomycetota bacterium]